ncbi:M23 family metallopeptidase [Streptomyces sp. SMC 277]|uniref:M23 family metallopeptidase n=1 Tax=Streptomyces antimicrobicus TaxID=2883108 RepID=A0ABS8BAC2_9ACTN|nr:M23 family metallopeptidase [Streptomyces antimicrobicus]MCB5181579.1 M23 family metallopeptidase [Streptomyces antimicrobicus]
MEDPESTGAGAWGEWNPTEDSVRPVRGRHRVAKQRGGGLARSSTVLGVGVIAAVGAGGIATAQDRPQVSISMPSLPSLATLTGDDDAPGEAADAGHGGTGRQVRGAVDTVTGAGAGEALRSRILQQAEAQSDAAAAVAKAAAEQAARDAATQEAKEKQEAARKAAEEAAAKEAADAKAKAEEEARAKAAEAKAAQEAQTPQAPAGSYFLPTSSYTITSTYGAAGSMWSSGHHTGLDFAAPTGTPVKAVAGGKIVSAGYSGAYGYRIVLELPDGTEIWYCHLSSMSVTSGSVGAGTTIGRVGATGNVTGPHLHLEVRTSGGSTVDPMAWLESKGLEV